MRRNHNSPWAATYYQVWPRPLDELAAELPADGLVTDPELIENYRYDWARDPDAGIPLAVVRPRTPPRCRRRCAGRAGIGSRWCPRGAGSGLSGGSSAVTGGIVLSLDRMRAIEIDPDCRVAIVEPGALNAEVKAAAREHGLWYPPDPSSFEICSIGGNIATNAGGLCCVKYGVTTDYVLGLDVVLADGTAITLGGARLKDVAGLSLLKLFVGSEGTLGIVTRAVLRLVPAQQPPSTLVATFASVDAAADAVVAISRTRASGDAGADGPGLDQRRRGLPLDGAGPQRRRPAGGPVRRRRASAAAAEIAEMAQACRLAGANEVFAPPTRSRARRSRSPGARRSRRSRSAAR